MTKTCINPYATICTNHVPIRTHVYKIYMMKMAFWAKYFSEASLGQECDAIIEFGTTSPRKHTLGINGLTDQ